MDTDTYIQKTKKTYTDTRTRRNLSNVATELQDVQRIMVSNIDDVLQRGVALTGVPILKLFQKNICCRVAY